ncbi:MAG TPA: alpha/beta fold hydrolase [Candidatus Acidoferrales bacterium]|nr:alpha/beta fold hydrolase [Candidatus Acidoferrales bacterium]
MNWSHRIASAAAALALIPACAGSPVRSLPEPGAAAPSLGTAPGAASAASVARGKIDRLWRVGIISKAQMEKGDFGQIVDELGGKPKCNVILYGMIYQTIGVKGDAADASAAFFVPGKGCDGPFPLVGYAHGTNPVKEQLITSPKTTSPTWTAPDQDPIVVAAIFAAHGYATAATDYLGLGYSKYPFHPYLVADAEASAVLDSMRAARNAAATLKIALSGKVFLTGHSQGGQSAMATQRMLEATTGKEFDLRGDAPSSGPYALTQTFIDSLHHQSEDAPILAAYILPAYDKTYGNVYSDARQIFRLPWATGINDLLPVQTYQQEAALYGKRLPLDLHKLLQPAFIKSYLDDPASGARVDTGHNDLLKYWTPKAPIYLCGGDKDPEVEFKNAEAAYAYFHAEHARVALIDVGPFIPKQVPMTDYHVVVALFCLPLARKNFFDPLK